MLFAEDARLCAMELTGLAQRPNWKRLSGLLLGLWICQGLQAQTTPVGEIARNFTLTNHVTGLPLRLTDYASQVVVLDFFTYWCPFCQESSPVIEEQVQKYYQGQKGNPAGLPVQVISVNLEAQNRPGTDQFIAGAGLELVIDDFAREAYNQFVFPGERVATLFVIINGVANANYRQWEVLYRTNSFEGISVFRGIIDSVQQAVAGAPLITAEPISETVLTGTPVIFSVEASGTPPLFFQWYKNGSILPGASNSVLAFSGASSRNAGVYSVTVSNSASVVRSGQALLKVIVPPHISNLRYFGGILAFDLIGGAGQEYQVQSSSNLVDWANVALAQSTNGTASFQDSRDCSSHFYRAIVP